jgi:hypothetical protein
LEAKILLLQGTHDEALATYRKAVDCACREQFTNLSALTHEYSAMLLMENWKRKDHLVFLGQAIDDCKSWGANAKAELLMIQYRLHAG